MVFSSPVFWMIMNRPYMLQRIKIWIFPLSDPQWLGYPAILSLGAFESAGISGLGIEGARSAALVLSDNLALNALPYLSLLWGNAVSILCIALLCALLGLLLRRIVRLGATGRNLALGIWLYIAISQIWAIGSPLGFLLPQMLLGVAFLGGGGVGCLLLLLGFFCFLTPVEQQENAQDS
jgi:cell division protein FtsW (lipid II flippase)